MKIEEMIIAKRADCCGCEACANICPKNAIVMTRDAEGFAYPKINPELCIQCGKCDATCPSLNFKAANVDNFPATFTATYDDDKILRHSSSGGMFTALSEIVLRDGGIVFGAGFDKNWHVYHTAARSLDELENLRGSKYVQSQIGDVYRQVRDALKSSKVLFTGTPCQCVGLRHFLGGDNENLLTVDILCHGTPSPALWESYIAELGHRNDIAHVNFRSKRNGWGGDIEINYSDKGHYLKKHMSNLYVKLFLIGLSERPSCHACKAKIPNNRSDLTIGDAWGVKNFAPEMYDSRGTSIVFIHTDKGKKFFEQTTLLTRQVRFIDATRYNLATVISENNDPRRAEFFADLSKTADKYAVMEKYYFQDDAELRKQTRKLNNRAYSVAYREIAAAVRKKFTENILVAAPIDDDAKKILIDRFAQTNPNSTIYFLRLNAKGEFVCKENFSALDFPLKKEADALKDFAEKFNVTKIVTDAVAKFDEPVVSDWLEKFLESERNAVQVQVDRH